MKLLINYFAHSFNTFLIFKFYMIAISDTVLPNVTRISGFKDCFFSSREETLFLKSNYVFPLYMHMAITKVWQKRTKSIVLKFESLYFLFKTFDGEANLICLLQCIMVN